MSPDKLPSFANVKIDTCLVLDAHLPGGQVRSLERRKASASGHQHSLNLGRSIILNARKHVGISLQRERNARVTELV
jgi:hypothetical protein